MRFFCMSGHVCVFAQVDMWCDAVMLQERGKDYLVGSVSKYCRDIHCTTPVSDMAKSFPRQV